MSAAIALAPITTTVPSVAKAVMLSALMLEPRQQIYEIIDVGSTKAGRIIVGCARRAARDAGIELVAPGTDVLERRFAGALRRNVRRVNRVGDPADSGFRRFQLRPLLIRHG